MKYWYSQNPVAWLLWPVSIIFCGISFVRRLCFSIGIFNSVSFDVPVVIIGNISVGGSGKTPLLISICEYLKQQGRKPGIVSRGYGGRITGVKQLDINDEAIAVGDEPCMIFQRTQCPVVVGSDRPAAVAHLLNNNDCDIVLSDDGLQHYRLQRSVEIAVVDAKRLHGNGFCLPAGPLREPVRRLKNVDMVVFNGKTDRQLKDNITSLFYALKFEMLVNLFTSEQLQLTKLKSKNILAVAAIGNPQRFFELLKQQGLTVNEQAFPDHYFYSDVDIQLWSGKCVLMTEKDAVKCRQRIQQKKINGDFTNLWYLPVSAKFNNELEQALNKLLL